MSRPIRVLLVDDERGFAKGLSSNLQSEGYRVEVAHHGDEAWDLFRAGEFDLVLLDLMLPGVDGMEVCRRIRGKSMVPIIMLTAKDDDLDKILGLEVGADDYLTKPFNFRELLARIRAVLRRAQHERAQGSSDEEHPLLAITEGLHLDVHRQLLRHASSREVLLTVKEFAVLELLARHPNRVFSREQLLDQVWGYDYFGSTRTVDVHMLRLRKKIEEALQSTAGAEVLKTRWGAGYYLESPS